MCSFYPLSCSVVLLAYINHKKITVSEADALSVFYLFSSECP